MDKEKTAKQPWCQGGNLVTCGSSWKKINEHDQ